VTEPPSNAPAAAAAAAAAGSGGASEIVFDAVTKRYPRRTEPAVRSLSLTVPAGEICVLVGPSGGGKTTAMRMVNRLIDITEGDIRIDGTSVRSLDATRLRRGIGYVIQQIGLFPHMTVAQNIGTVPRLLGWDRARIRSRARELVELVGLDPGHDLERYPAELSGGQRQRVGLARAMAADPPLMLMDEPFGALDPITRARLQDEFLRLHRAMRKTVIFVTHDIDEAIKMGDLIAILREGGILAQYATPDQVLAAPADDFVARFVGADRALKRLALMTLADLELEPAGQAPGDGPSGGLATPLRDALSTILGQGGRPLTVLGDDRRPVGVATLETVARALSSPPARPRERAG
jgi:osmoprotectant transport system ATP-binding protein